MERIRMMMAVTAGLAAIAFLTACSGGLKELDVVGQQSIPAFDQVLKAIPHNVQAHEGNAGWALTAPDDSVRFIWRGDYNNPPLYDIMLEISAEPFLSAGLDPDKLPDHYIFYQGDGMDSNMLMVGVKLDSKDKVSGAATALLAYENIVNNHRDSIGYHPSLDHYGVKLGNGNMFEWAKDMKVNDYDNSNQDKDIVFVLNPEPLIAAGVVPEQVEGWVYAQVLAEENGKMTQVWKFLKPFDLK